MADAPSAREPDVGRGTASSLELDPTSSVAPYEQVRAQITQQVESGALAPGHRLPTVRALAGELGVAPGTVARAYRELEQAGVIETRGRAGSFVTAGGVEREARAAALDYLGRTRALGLSSAEAVEVVRRLS